MNMPVIAATRLESHVEHRDLFGVYRGEVTLPHEKLCEGIVGFPNREQHFLLVTIPTGQRRLRRRLTRSCLAPYLFGQVEPGPGFGSTHIEPGVGNNRGDFPPAHPVALGVFQMVFERGIGDSTGHQGDHSDDALGLHVYAGLVPYLSEQNIIVKLRKKRREILQLFLPSSLRNFSHMSFSFPVILPR